MKKKNVAVDYILNITCEHPKTHCKCEYNIIVYTPDSDTKLVNESNKVIKKLRTKLKKFLNYKEEIRMDW